jgi:hypothetical protein
MKRYGVLAACAIALTLAVQSSAAAQSDPQPPPPGVAPTTVTTTATSTTLTTRTTATTGTTAPNRNPDFAAPPVVPPTQPADRALPVTGADLLMIAGVGVAAVAAGVVVRRRARPSTQG